MKKVYSQYFNAWNPNLFYRYKNFSIFFFNQWRTVFYDKTLRSVSLIMINFTNKTNEGFFLNLEILGFRMDIKILNKRGMGL